MRRNLHRSPCPNSNLAAWGVFVVGTVDNLMRTAQQHHVALSSMADTKANIIITVSSNVLTLSLGRVNDPELRHLEGVVHRRRDLRAPMAKRRDRGVADRSIDVSLP